MSTRIAAPLLAMLLLLVLSSVSFAQTPPEEYTVLGITVEGNISGSSEMIIGQSTIKQGDKITIPSEVISRAINRLWQSNIYADVNIEATKIIPQADGKQGAYLTIKVKEFPHADSVIIDGNKNIGLSDIQKA